MKPTFSIAYTSSQVIHAIVLLMHSLANFQYCKNSKVALLDKNVRISNGQNSKVSAMQSWGWRLDLFHRLHVIIFMIGRICIIDYQIVMNFEVLMDLGSPELNLDYRIPNRAEVKFIWFLVQPNFKKIKMMSAINFSCTNCPLLFYIQVFSYHKQYEISGQFVLEK